MTTHKRHHGAMGLPALAPFHEPYRSMETDRRLSEAERIALKLMAKREAKVKPDPKSRITLRKFSWEE